MKDAPGVSVTVLDFGRWTSDRCKSRRRKEGSIYKNGVSGCTAGSRHSPEVVVWSACHPALLVDVDSSFSNGISIVHRFATFVAS